MQKRRIIKKLIGSRGSYPSSYPLGSSAAHVAWPGIGRGSSSPPARSWVGPSPRRVDHRQNRSEANPHPAAMTRRSCAWPNSESGSTIAASRPRRIGSHDEADFLLVARRALGFPNDGGRFLRVGRSESRPSRRIRRSRSRPKSSRPARGPLRRRTFTRATSSKLSKEPAHAHARAPIGRLWRKRHPPVRVEIAR
jgi:hypothetical protein